jgi:soluble lytic murein transglycosylase-like protein
MKARRQRHSHLLLSALLGGLIFVHHSITIAATNERPDEEMRNTLIKAIESSDSFKDRFDAEVWLTDMSQRLEPRVKDPKERLAILKTVHYEAQRADIDPELVLAVIDVESRYDRFAISSAGAQGLMQIMPFWLNEIGHPEDNLFAISTNIRLGCTILKYYLNMEKGNLARALARYNGSVGKFWYPKLVFNALSSRWYKQ